MRAGCRVETCEGGRRLERLLEAEDWDAVLADLDTAPLEELAAIEATERAPALLLLAAFKIPEPSWLTYGWAGVAILAFTQLVGGLRL